MVIDSSAVIAILLDEPEAESLMLKVVQANDKKISAANYLETGIILGRDPTLVRLSLFNAFLKEFCITVTPVTEDQANLALTAFYRFGKGCKHPAKLNYGDCFAYALAKQLNEPLLFKGNDFSSTDLQQA